MRGDKLAGERSMCSTLYSGASSEMSWSLRTAVTTGKATQEQESARKGGLNSRRVALLHPSHMSPHEVLASRPVPQCPHVKIWNDFHSGECQEQD